MCSWFFIKNGQFDPLSYLLGSWGFYDQFVHKVIHSFCGKIKGNDAEKLWFLKGYLLNVSFMRGPCRSVVFLGECF